MSEPSHDHPHDHAHGGHDDPRDQQHGGQADPYVQPQPVSVQQESSVAIGRPAPEIRLPDLAGRIRTLDEHRGQETLVVFWHPDCGFCVQMLPDLRAWESSRTESAPRLFVVSGGSVVGGASVVTGAGLVVVAGGEPPSKPAL